MQLFLSSLILFCTLTFVSLELTFIKTEPSVGSIFGRPYNARPFVPRFPGTQPSTADVAEVPARPTPERGVFPNDRTSAGSSDLIWNKPNRWEKEKAANQRFNMTRVQSIDAECQNDYMKIRLRFNGSFSGIIYSTGENLNAILITFNDVFVIIKYCCFKDLHTIHCASTSTGPVVITTSSTFS